MNELNFSKPKGLIGKLLDYDEKIYKNINKDYKFPNNLQTYHNIET